MDSSVKSSLCFSPHTCKKDVIGGLPWAMIKNSWRKYVVITFSIVAVVLLLFWHRASSWSLVRTKPSQVEQRETDVILDHVTYINQSNSNINLQQILSVNNGYVKKINLVDALWTLKPDLQNKQNNRHGEVSNLMNSLTQQADEVMSETDSNEPDEAANSPKRGGSSKTTPMYSTERSTNPITTQSITTPIYTEAATASVTTESITTPSYTEPAEITTEADPNDMRILLRHRRGANPTPTTPSSVTTSVPVPTLQCVSPSYLSAGSCQCPLGFYGADCSSELTVGGSILQDKSTVSFESSMMGTYNNDTRADFQAELENHYASTTGFVRVYVRLFVYDPVTNTTHLLYDVLYDSVVNARRQSQSAGMTSQITDHTLPININGQAVQFSVNDTYLVLDQNKIPLGDQTTRDHCQLYNDIDACNSAMGGTCIVSNNTATCLCSGDMYGEFCDSEMLYAPDDGSDVLPVLLPAIGGAVAAMFGVLIFVYCCVRRKAKPEEPETVIHDVPSTFLRLPRFRRLAPGFKYFDPGTYGDAYSNSGEFYSQASAASTEEEDVSTHPSQLSNTSLLPRLVLEVSTNNDPSNAIYRDDPPSGYYF